LQFNGALYMGVITLTTVGFGDRTPKTQVGKAFASLWMIVGTVAFSIMMGKFSTWTFFIFNKTSVDKLDMESLDRMLKDEHFMTVAANRGRAISGMLGDVTEKIRKDSEEHAIALVRHPMVQHKDQEAARKRRQSLVDEASNLYANRISRNDFLMFMCIDMGLVDEDMVLTLNQHFSDLDVTGEGYIDHDDLEDARLQEKAMKQEASSLKVSHGKRSP